jgi:hypothetical protein
MVSVLVFGHLIILIQAKSTKTSTKYLVITYKKKGLK